MRRAEMRHAVEVRTGLERERFARVSASLAHIDKVLSKYYDDLTAGGQCELRYSREQVTLFNTGKYRRRVHGCARSVPHRMMSGKRNPV